MEYIEGRSIHFSVQFGHIVLFKKIASEEAKNPNVVAATRLELVTPGL